MQFQDENNKREDFISPEGEGNEITAAETVANTAAEETQAEPAAVAETEPAVEVGPAAETEPTAETEPADGAKQPKRFGKKAQYRTVAAVFTVLVVVIAVVVNFLVQLLGQKVNLRVDLTKGQILDFSDQTIEVLNSLDKDIMVYSLLPESDNEILASLDSILERYQQLSPHIKYEKIDTTRNPQFVQKYQKGQTEIDKYSVIFERGDRFRVVDLDDMYQGSSQGQQIQLLPAERSFTAAIQYVASDINVRVAFTQGHGEVGQEVFGDVLAEESYDTTAITLATEDIGEDISLLIIASPQMDFAAEEIEKLDMFFDRGGKVQLFMDVNVGELPRLDAYLKEWGVTFQPGFVLETNRNNYVQSPLLMLPDVQESEITDAIRSNNLMLIIPQARGLELTQASGVASQTLLRTTREGFTRVNREENSLAMVEGDIAGPIDLAALLSRMHNEKKGELFVMGTTLFADPTFLEESAYANRDFYLNVTTAMTNPSNSLSIRAKDISPTVLAISLVQVLVLGGIVLIVIPLLVLIIGLVVWFRRRHL